MDIKEFLKETEVQTLLEENNLDKIYQMLTDFEPSELTEFLMSIDVDPLQYVTKIVNYMFYRSHVIHIKLTNNITSIGKGAFDQCRNLRSMTIPDTVTSIGNYAFYICDNLTSITIPDSVNSIGSHAFDGCKKLTSVTIGNGVKSIGDYAFVGCEKLTTITIPNSVKSIGDRAFWICHNLTINCEAWSTAYFYARNNDIPYKLV